MSIINITINTDNAAFEDGDELPRILRRLADTIGHEDLTTFDGWSLRDVNGNKVGTVRVS
jgi:hypothetical protein